jgi:tetratricopeptide (TPR) repeat protein
MKLHTTLLVVAAHLLMHAPAHAQEPPHAHSGHEHRLGSVAFPNSGAAAAQEPFLRGIALLHSFEYEDAADAFVEAQAADPDFALAYWAEALTNSRLLWGREDLPAARHALARLGPTPEARLDRAATPRERAYGAAVEALYVDADVATRARAFADSLRALAHRDPDDLEAAAFASIALQMAAMVGGIDMGERARVRDDAIALADRVFRANRDHPGAAHYLIHAYDDPDVAAQGLEVARAYAGIAPDAQHALHMPSHIFVQVGLWDDVVSSNERAWAASRDWARRRAADGTALDFHSLEWLQHGYLQQGRYRDALALVDTVRAVLAGAALEGSVDPYFVEQRLAFRYAAETRDWSKPLATVSPDGGAAAAESRYAYFRYVSLYQAAIGAVMQGDTAAAAIDAFRGLIASGGAPGARSGAVATAQLDALLDRARGDRDAATDHLRRAAAEEAPISPVGPPTLLPSLEWLGDLLLDAGRPAEAADAYQRALLRWPNRSPSLLGLARAQHILGDHAAAADTFTKLLANWHAADETIPALEEARRHPAP